MCLLNIKQTNKILEIHSYWLITTKSNNKINNNNNDQGQLFWHASLKFHRENQGQASYCFSAPRYIFLIPEFALRHLCIAHISH